MRGRNPIWITLALVAWLGCAQDDAQTKPAGGTAQRAPSGGKADDTTAQARLASQEREGTSADAALAAANAAESTRKSKTAPACATSSQARQAVDLVKLPRLEVVRALEERPTYIYYSGRASIAAADAFYQAELKSRGWKMVENSIPSTDQYADRLFEKQGYSLRVTLGASGEEGVVGVGLSNLGNIDVRALPRLNDAEIMGEPTAIGITYRTAEGIAAAARTCREQLSQAGWQVYTDFSPGLESVPHYEGFTMRNQGLALMVSIAKDPKNPSQKTSVSYLASEALPFDLHVAKDGTQLKIDLLRERAEYRSDMPLSDLVAFHEATARELGWTVREDSAVGEKDATLFLEEPDQLGFGVRITREEEHTLVSLTRLSFAESEPSSDPQAEAAAPEAGDLAQTDPPAEHDEVDDAVNEAKRQVARELAKAKKTLKGLGADVPADLLKALDEVEDADADDDDTEMDESNDQDETGDQQEEKPPAALASAGQVDKQAIAKQGTACTVTLDGKQYKFSHALAVETDSFGTLAPMLLFSSKPFAEKKLARALASGQEISLFDITEGLPDSLEIRFSESTTSLSCFVDGLSVNLSSSDVEAGFVVEGDHVLAQAELKNHETFGKSFSFELTCDLELHRRVAAPAGAPGELARDASQDLPLPDGCEGFSTQDTKYRTVLTARIAAGLDKVVAFYDRELARDEWEENKKRARSDADLVHREFATQDARLTLVLRREGESTSIEVTKLDDKLAQEQGVKPAKGKGRLMLANGGENEVVFTVGKKEYKLAAHAGAQDPSQATKVDVEPGKTTITIQPKDGKSHVETVDIEAGTTWGVIAIPDGGVFSDRVY